MSERVVVIGAGLAGLAATWAAAQRGAELSLVDGGAGASCLAAGAVDEHPWDQLERSFAMVGSLPVVGSAPAAGAAPQTLEAFVSALALWHFPKAGEPMVRLATDHGRIRVARGCDRALLDLSRLPSGARVLLPRLPREDWDADTLAPALSAEPYAQEAQIRFEAVEAQVFRHRGELRIGGVDLAMVHDDAARRSWLGQRLRELVARHGQVDALLFGPWLGTELGAAQALEDELQLPVGEVLGGVGSAAGLRFETARARLLASLDVALSPGRVKAVERERSELVVSLEDGERIRADAVVLALGGVAGGGVVYDPPEVRAEQEIAPAGGPPFRLSLSPQFALAAKGQRLDVVGSIHGPALDSVAWPHGAEAGLLETVGIAGQGHEVAPGIYAAGDVMADRPRTALVAVGGGLAAGAAAAGAPGSTR